MAQPEIRTVAKAAAVTPSDTTVIFFRALWCGTSGTFVVTQLDDTDVTYPAAAAGMWHPIRGKKVKAASTALTIVAALDGQGD